MDSSYLTQKQREFCTNYVGNGLNIYKAALEAGYSHKYSRVLAPKLLDHPLIKERITKAFNNAEERLTLTWEWKLKKLKRVIDTYIPDDSSQELIQSNVKVGLIALAELNNMQGDYAPVKRLSMTVDATKNKLEEVRRIYEEY